MADLVIRPAGQDDLEVLWDFLAIAAYEPDAAAAKAVPGVAAYLAGWRRPGDFGFVAERESEIIGASWARQFATTEDLRAHYGDERTPKLSIGVKPDASLGSDTANFRNRLQRTDLIICVHHGDEPGGGTQGAANIFGIDHAIAADRNVGNRDTAPFEFLARVQYCRMLDGGGDNVNDFAVVIHRFRCRQ